MKRIFVTGAFGLVGSDLVPQLAKKYGKKNVIVLGNKTIGKHFHGVLAKGDVRDKKTLEKIIKQYNISEVYHLAGLLSVGGEKNPDLAWDVNINGLRNILDLARDYKLKVFWPSSIAAFGPTTPKQKTPQHTVLEPTTIYGVTKLSGELMCQYYFLRWGVDVRSLRYPGLIGYQAPPGDGTTEYSVHIFYGLLKELKYSCFLKADARLPMMYIDDAIRGTMALMDAPAQKISIRTSYNFGSINFAPRELVSEIKKLYPAFICTYNPHPIKQRIAESWPQSIDDSQARKDWGWKHEYNLAKMTKVMINGLEKKLKVKR
ncbi:NAD-dependent epimerase/dehydratase family protein [Candidatus Gottesmanbacteria bacterium]|nr:NAD-dependent epimerase/dehydratase family protein [Candidatus Gottesmanbacteria bacterium]